MTKNELVKILLELDSEYMYQDIGYGGFINSKTFMIQGKRIPVSRITREELQEMVDEEIKPLIREFKIFG